MVNSSGFNKSLVPFVVIAEATQGDITAMDAVLRHFEGYIASLSMRHFYGRHGISYYIVDEEMRQRLRTKLIMKVLDFKVA